MRMVFWEGTQRYPQPMVARHTGIQLSQAVPRVIGKRLVRTGAQSRKIDRNPRPIHRFLKGL